MEIFERDLELGGIYHSHTHSPAYPSQTDINLALHPQATYLIIGLADEEPEVNAFRIVDGKVEDEPIELISPE